MQPTNSTIKIYNDTPELAAVTAARIVAKLGWTLDERAGVENPCNRLVHWVVTGGGVGTECLRRIAEDPVVPTLDWTRVHVWWGDERFLPSGDPERNETGARAALFDALISGELEGSAGVMTVGIPLPEKNLHVMPAADADVADPAVAAGLYAEDLARFAPEDSEASAVPQFDLVLLGVGPDGHVASLFPGNAGLKAEGFVTGVLDSPKPPPERVSLTFDAINQAVEVWLLAAGAEKAPAVRTAHTAPRSDIPAAGVHGTRKTEWLLDRSSAYLLD